jgi:hypothetical protein
MIYYLVLIDLVCCTVGKYVKYVKLQLETPKDFSLS